MATVEDPLESGMTYVEKIDYRDQKHRHSMEMAKLNADAEVRRSKYRAAETRHKMLQNVGISIVVAASILVVIFLIWKAVTAPDGPGPTKEERREQACIASGGGWVPEDLLSNASDGMCVFPGKIAG